MAGQEHAGDAVMNAMQENLNHPAHAGDAVMNAMDENLNHPAHAGDAVMNARQENLNHPARAGDAVMNARQENLNHEEEQPLNDQLNMLRQARTLARRDLAARSREIRNMMRRRTRVLRAAARLTEGDLIYLLRQRAAP